MTRIWYHYRHGLSVTLLILQHKLGRHLTGGAMTRSKVRT